MKIQDLFERDLFRPINGVVKADQLDDCSVWQELDEFVVTRELDQHFRRFFSSYCEAIDRPNDPDVAGKIGVWVSGFFGSGKSHFIKVLSYLLRNGTHTHNQQSRRAVEFFASKIQDAMLFGDIQRAVASETDVILFNIDSKADHRSGRDALLAVFLKVLNEMQGYSGDHPHIAHLERYLEAKGKLARFHQAFRQATGAEWTQERDAYPFHRDQIVQALTEALGLSRESAEKWIDGAEDTFALTVENFCQWVKETLDSRGPDHRLLFLVDEVGQFIGADSHLMLSLQTIIEELGALCRGRAWVVVTSQEEIDAVLGDIQQARANDFSKIQGRFRTRLSLSSANVDEVIQSRLLAKRTEAVGPLQRLFQEKGDILKHQLTFAHCGMTLRPYRDSDDFVRNYPFAPYQFQLVQKIFEAIRKAGATGLHLSRGERSILDAFQSAGKQVGPREIGILVPLYRFYPSIESFLDTSVKRTIDQAGDNAGLEPPFDTHLLQVLFLIRYVEEMRGTVDNLVTLCMEEIDADRLALRRRIEEGLQRLEKETLIGRNGDVYFFLTNEERDINREIKSAPLESGEEARLLGELLFHDVLKEQRKYRYPANKMDFTFNRLCDRHPIGSRVDGALLVSIVTSLNDDYASFGNGRCLQESGAEGGHVLIRLGNEESLGRELRTYLQTEKTIRHKNDGTLAESTRRILRGISEDNLQRRERLVKLLGEMLVGACPGAPKSGAAFFVAGQALPIKAATPNGALDEALEYLVRNTFTKMGSLQRLSPEPLKEVQAILHSNDIARQTLVLQTEAGNQPAIDDLRGYLELCAQANRQIVLHDLIEKRYALRPYGWPDEEVLILVARLLVLGEISLMLDGALVSPEKAYDALATPAKRRKGVLVKRRTSDPAVLQNARRLGKELFHQMGPDGEDALFAFVQDRLQSWQASLSGYQPLADTGRYPGQEEIGRGLALVKKLLACEIGYQFIERFNDRKDELLDLADRLQDLEHFYERQQPTWEKLRQAYERFRLNRLELDRDAQAGPALQRMEDILAAPSPYGLLQEADGLIQAVGAVNTALLGARRRQALEKIEGHIAALARDLEPADSDPALRSDCLEPLKSLRVRVDREDSLAHLAQAEAEALNAFDAAVRRMEESVKKAAEQVDTERTATARPRPVIKRQRIVEPARLMKTAYLETLEEMHAFLDALRQELEKAIAHDERVQIR